jgi:hypothetical protein
LKPIKKSKNCFVCLNSLHKQLIQILLLLLLGGLLIIDNKPHIDKLSDYVFVWQHNGPILNFNYLQLVVISLGFCLVMISTVIVNRQVNIKKMLQQQNLLTMILLLAIFHIGFKNYPYWAIGLQHAKHSLASGYYDPKALLQETGFIGTVWYASMLLFLSLSICSIAFLLLLLFCKKISLRQFCCGFIVYLFNLILLMLTPDFIPWLLD